LRPLLTTHVSLFTFFVYQNRTALYQNRTIGFYLYNYVIVNHLDLVPAFYWGGIRES